MDVEVRRARRDELSLVGALTVEAYVADGWLGSDDDYVAELRDAAGRAREAELYVAVSSDGGEVLGTVTFCTAGSSFAEVSRTGQAEFRMLAVAPAARRRGVAEALVRRCVERARELGCSDLVLSSMAEMAAAHRLYERMGFRRCPELDWAPEPGTQLLGFTLGLGSPG